MASSLVRIVRSIRETLRKYPRKGLTTFMSASSLQGILRSEVHIRNHRLLVDEPPAMGGGDAGPSPVELVLAALGTCQEISYRLCAADMGIEITRVAARVEGDLDLRGLFAVDDSVRPGFGEVRLVIELESNADEAQLEMLRRNVDAHCPVLDIIRNPVPVTIAHVAAGGSSE